MEIASLDAETVAAVIAAAHAEGLAAVVHVSTLERALEAMAFGADGLVHVWRDEVVSEVDARRFAEADIFVVPRFRSSYPPPTPSWRNWCRRQTKRCSHRFSSRHSPIASRAASRRAEK